jgi:DNA (cytosine-5)-methyltransferase 1
MENVPGLVKGHMKPVFVEILNALRACGYQVSARVLNAAYYGVPQARERVIFIGFRDDLQISPSHPDPQTRPVSFLQATKGLSDLGPILKPTGDALQIARALKAGENGSHLHTRYGRPGHHFSLIRLAWEKPSPTVCKTVRAGQCGLLHPEEERFLSMNELKRVCSFPDEFRLEGPFEAQWARLGNAVPPLLMKAIARHIVAKIALGELSRHAS